MRTLVVVPSKNLEDAVGDVVRQVLGLDLGLDVLVIDDGSTDDTSRVAREAGAEVIEHPENLGKGAALKTGFEYALERGYEAVVTLDGDGQHDPAAIPQFLEALEKTGADIVIGTRMHAVGEMPKLRIWTNRTTSRVVSLLSRPGRSSRRDTTRSPSFWSAPDGAATRSRRPTSSRSTPRAR